MVKDINLLKSVSNNFTEDVLKKIVINDKILLNLKINDIEIVSWKFCEASAKGDSNLSVLNKIHIISKITDNNQLLDTIIVVKSLPKSIGQRKTLRCIDFFYNEIIFYKKVYFLCLLGYEKNFGRSFIIKKYFFM